MQSDRLRRTGSHHRRGGAASSESSAATPTIAAAVAAPPLHAPECGFSLGEREAASRRALAPHAYLPRSRRPGARPPAAPYAPRTSARAARRRLGTEGARAARWGSAGVGAGVQRLQLS